MHNAQGLQCAQIHELLCADLWIIVLKYVVDKHTVSPSWYSTVACENQE